MKRYAVIAAAIALVALIVAAIVPMWIMTADVQLPNAALGAIVFMIIGCFGVGGGLMFLIFYSARKGYDDAVHHGGSRVTRMKPPSGSGSELTVALPNCWQLPGNGV